ncbi:Rab gdp-dissociation inhibitor [Thalictrum thalictroides]|uniref:Rab escort protein 1 n=1 Tax=Thalictrum thalictroides TaxID=46969 RepID=A0A7J6WNQ8_THATH|nr:Rab gdp-dissociation inhibitor [Thalictrum thalictroides]
MKETSRPSKKPNTLFFSVSATVEGGFHFLVLKEISLKSEEEESMAEDFSFPSIDPINFDLAVVGTGLPESIIAASSSSIGKTVLHLDPNSFYGGHFSSFSLHEFTSFLQSQQQQPNEEEVKDSNSSLDTNYTEIELKSQCLYSDIEITSNASSEDLEPSRKFCLDLSGPRVLFCADSVVNLMLKSGANHHVEFKSIDASFIYSEDGNLFTVPDSRSAIFKDRSLGLLEKNQLMRFFKLVQAHFGLNESTLDQEKKRISDEDLESPFIEFLTKQMLPAKIKAIILYAIAMIDYDQESPEQCKNLVKTKDGVEKLALYHSSVGRFTNALGALLYPIYGQGELPQAFCRTAAVKGALYVLRMPVRSLLFDKESRHYKGLKLASGQAVFSDQLVMGPSFIVPSPPVLSPHTDLQQEISQGSILRDINGQVARAVCITRGSIKSNISNMLVVFPPRSLLPEQVTAVRVLQLGSNLSVCPTNLFLLYVSALCDDATQGKKSLHAAINALLKCSMSKNRETSSLFPNESEVVTPTLLWSAMYIQQLTKVLEDPISSCPMPDGNLGYTNILESTEKLFQKIYPGEEFMPEAKAPENVDEQES